MSFKSITVLATAALGLFAGAAQAQLLANGGFETAGVAPLPAASWLSNASGYTLASGPGDARTGSFAAQLASPALNAAGMEQNSVEQGGLPALTVGTSPVLEFYAKGFAGSTGNVVYALRYLSSTGTILYNSLDQSFSAAINPNTYSKITFNGGVVPAGATAAFLQFSQSIGPIGTGPAGENWLAGRVLIDDISLSVAAPIPEPGTYALMLLGLGAMGAVARRRRAAA